MSDVNNGDPARLRLLMKVAHDVALLTATERDYFVSLLGPITPSGAAENVPEETKPMRVETAIIPSGFTTITTSVSKAIVHLGPKDIYYRCEEHDNSAYWVVLRGKVPGIYNNAEEALAQVSGVSNCKQQAGFDTMAEAEAFLALYLKKKDGVWGVMVNQPNADN